VPAVTEIVQTEAAELGPGLRALVLCEFESVGGMVPTRLAGVIDPKAGGAVLALTALPESAPELDPVLLTGQRVGSSRPCQRSLPARQHSMAPGAGTARKPMR
jgi:hypothetical protein